MGTHQLKDGRWYIEYRILGSLTKHKREYFGRGEEARQEALKRSDDLALMRNMDKHNLTKTGFIPRAGIYLHKDGRWYVEYRNPMNGNKVKREYFGRGLINKSKAVLRKNEIMRGEFYTLEKNITKGLVYDLRDELHTKDIRTEVKTQAGNIDIMTPYHIVEVKNIMEWKNAVGQIMAYSFYFPDKKKRIYLFGKANDRIKKTISEVCNHVGITATFCK